MFVEFCQQIADAAGSIPVKYPGTTRFSNGSETPPDAGQWIQVIWNQSGVQDYAYSDTDSGVRVGFFRVLVRDKDAAGVKPAQDIAEALAAAIGKGAQLGEASVTGTPDITGPVMDDKGENIIVTVTWRYRTH